jgi:glucose/arabinose dehydrogenase/cytochrome c2
MAARTFFALAVLLGAVSAPSFGADAVAGRSYFRAQCALCHSAETGDSGGAQGPNLQGVLGRKAGSSPDYNYTAALKNSGIVWDAVSLQNFLANPSGVVPGTAMVIPVPDPADRENLAVYFAAVRDGTLPAEQAPLRMAPSAAASGADAVAANAVADWKKDAPGRVHRIDINSLPAPFATASARNVPRVVPKPDGAKLAVPAGFHVDVFVEGLSGPRSMLLAPNGDVIVAETKAGKLKVLRPSADGKSATVTVFASGLQQPYGLAFYPSPEAPRWLYVAEVNRVVRYAFQAGSTKAIEVPEVVIPQLSPVAGGHVTRDMAFSPDGKKLYVAVGSLSNFAEKMAKKSVEEARSWEAGQGLGAAWDNEENRAQVRVFDVLGGNADDRTAGMFTDTRGRAYATGLRNCAGMTLEPDTGAVWCAVNERDALGDNLVPDYVTRVQEGAYYGWPWYYLGNREDPRLAGERPDLAGKMTNPDVPFTSHSAALNIKFYNAMTGSSLFPAKYHGTPFVVLHGSWNRGERTGHKVVTLPMRHGKPTGEYVDFLTGFINEEGDAWGRPVAIVVAKDGSLLLADDGGHVIYRVSYGK